MSKENLVKDLGVVAPNGVYYSPKYWVLKWNDSTDVAIETASKSLLECQSKARKLFRNDVLDTHSHEYTLIEVSKVDKV